MEPNVQLLSQWVVIIRAVIDLRWNQRQNRKSVTPDRIELFYFTGPPLPPLDGQIIQIWGKHRKLVSQRICLCKADWSRTAYLLYESERSQPTSGRHPTGSMCLYVHVTVQARLSVLFVVSAHIPSTSKVTEANSLQKFRRWWTQSQQEIYRRD